MALFCTREMDSNNPNPCMASLTCRKDKLGGAQQNRIHKGSILNWDTLPTCLGDAGSRRRTMFYADKNLVPATTQIMSNVN